MAGSPNNPAQSAKPAARVLKCGTCSATIPLRGLGQTLTRACEYCGAVTDLSDGANSLILKSQRLASKPLIPLGSRGKLAGVEWEVIGFMVRSDGSGQYEWREYLLFNPYHGFRWLVEANGHWNYVTPTKQKPSNRMTIGGRWGVIYESKHFAEFLSGEARVRMVLGEFYWQVKVGDTVKVADYIAPPAILSMERDDNEENYSYGVYLEPDLVKKVFPNIVSLPWRKGISPNQPAPGEKARFPVLIISLVMLVVLIAITNVFGPSGAKFVYSGSFVHGVPAGQTALTLIPEFTLGGRTSNLGVRIDAPVNNNWMSFDVELIDLETGEEQGGEIEVSYYSGSDSDGPWTEGSQSESIIFPHVAPGRYSMSITSEVGLGTMNPPFSVIVRRSMPYWGNFILALILISLPVALLWGRYLSFESRRWQDSDQEDE